MNTVSMAPVSTLETQALLARHRITPYDLELVRISGAQLLPRLAEYVEQFYAWLQQEPEFGQYFHDEPRLRHVQNMQVEYWKRFFTGDVDDAYVKQRRHVGEVHARIGLSVAAYFAAMDISLAVLTDMLLPSETRYETSRAITRLVHLDTAVVTVAYNQLTNEKLAGQSQALAEMSTPVTSVAEDVLMLPVVGLIDSRRAQEILSSVLGRIAETRARVFIIDISGVSVVDTAVANHLIKLTRATRLMGCKALLSGLSPAIAQTIIELGIDVSAIDTHATLRDALEEALRLVGVKLVRSRHE